jgi:hypothetical protein
MRCLSLLEAPDTMFLVMINYPVGQLSVAHTLYFQIVFTSEMDKQAFSR